MSLANDPPCAPSHAIPTRVTERIRTEVEVDSESHFFSGLRGDVAKDGGLFIATHRALGVGQTVLVEMSIEAMTVIAIGIVRWRTPGGAELPPGVGVTFSDMSDRDRQSIENFCARRPPFYFDAGDRLSVA
jgi:Tfp pilus assembly protein PilZ